jgi:hypothetical protein
MRQEIPWALILLMLLALAAPLAAQAAVVGRVTLVTGQVDLLRQGKIPGVPARVQDGVEPGDVVRTKSKSKAQLKMVDDAVITLAPESRLAVADYSFNPTTSERRAVIKIFRGLVHTLVTRLLNVAEANFLMETYTAGLGVRGTEWYTLLAPAFTAVYLVQGRLDVRSNLPTLPAVLSLGPRQFTQVPLGQQPRLPQPLTPAMLQMLQRLMETGVQEAGGLGLGGEITAPGGSGVPLELPVSPERQMQPTIPPTLQPAPPAPPPGPRG